MPQTQHGLTVQFFFGQAAGIALWQFADIPVDRAVSDEQHRPRGLNNKGVLRILASRISMVYIGLLGLLLLEFAGAC